jgi:hypothetical protein
MKTSHLATIGLLAISSLSAIGAIGLVAHQYTIQRSAVQVVANTAVVERMQGFSDALSHVPNGERQVAVAKYGFLSENAFESALMEKRGELETSLKVRAEELATNDKRLTALLAAFGFNAIIAIMSAFALYDTAASRRQITDRPAERVERVARPTTP